jgi:hypothetical protein
VADVRGVGMVMRMVFGAEEVDQGRSLVVEAAIGHGRSRGQGSVGEAGFGPLTHRRVLGSGPEESARGRRRPSGGAGHRGRAATLGALMVSTVGCHGRGSRSGGSGGLSCEARGHDMEQVAGLR